MYHHFETKCVPEGHLRLLPLQTLQGVSLPPHVAFQLRAELVRDATPWPAHRPGNSKIKFPILNSNLAFLNSLNTSFNPKSSNEPKALTA